MSFNDKKLKANKLGKMPKYEYDELIDLLRVQASSYNEKMVYHYIARWLESRGIEYTTDAIGNIIATKGETDIYPCIVSHMDTVHDIHEDFRIMYHRSKLDGNTILTAQSDGKIVGVGGDDKCGIFATLYMLDNLNNVKAVFFTQEESGCIGSDNIDITLLDDVGYIIQLDRWGSSDFICNYCGESTCSPEFLKKAGSLYKKYNYKSASGLITDSINLWNSDVGVSCVNVSCGYYEHHSNNEYIDVNELWNSVMFTYDLIQMLGCVKYESKPAPVIASNKWKSGNSNKASSYDNYNYYDLGYDTQRSNTQLYDESDESTLLYDAIDWDACDWDVLLSIIKSSSFPSDIIYDLEVNSIEAVILEDEYFLLTNSNLLK